MIYQKILNSVSKSLKLKPKYVSKYIIETPNFDNGDFSINILMQKPFVQNSDSYFKQIYDNLIKIRGIKSVLKVNLFINVFLDPLYFINNNEKIKKDDKKVMVEFSSPNSNKPLHLGHLRNILIGDTVSNLLSLKHNVIRANLINDRGIHICKSMIGYELLGSKTPEDFNLKSDHFVGLCYVEYSKKEAEDEGLKLEAEKCLYDWENRDKKTIDLWKKMNKWCIDGINETYRSLDVKFDYVFYESKIYKKGKKVVLDMYDKGIVKRDDKGNYYMSLEKYNLPKKNVLRADGTSIYATQDIYLGKYKFDKFGIDKSILVIGSEQNLYFEQLFKIFKEFNYPFWSDMYHLSYGMVYLPQGKMKSREGTVIDADDFIEQVKLKVKEVVSGRSRIVYDDLKIKKLAMAAIRYGFLSYDKDKDFVFDYDKLLSFDSNSGPYVLYTYARINSLISNIRKKRIKLNPTTSKIYTNLEEELARKIGKFNFKIIQTIDRMSPHILIKYITELSNMFNLVYSNVKFLTNKNEMKSRLVLLNKLKSIYDEFFKIYNIKPLKSM